jgi:hypothetical protein
LPSARAADGDTTDAATAIAAIQDLGWLMSTLLARRKCSPAQRDGTNFRSAAT